MNTAKQKRSKKGIARTISIAVLVYLASYVVLSFLGDYSKTLHITHHRYTFGVGIPTTQIWEPLFVKNTRCELNFPGWLFAPCVHLDRMWWHKGIDITEIDWEKGAQSP